MVTHSQESAISFIGGKIGALKSQYSVLRSKSDEYVFSALCIKDSIYKDPALPFSSEVFSQAIVDGPHDNGVDFLLLDPNNREAYDLIIGQSKYYTNPLSFEDAKNAVAKMVCFYREMTSQRFEHTRDEVVRRFCSLHAEVGDESKIVFALYTSSPQNNIREERIKREFRTLVGESEKYELRLFWGKDIVEEIREAESRQPSVETGKLLIDAPHNILSYKDGEAIVVNISARSLKDLYALHANNLLSMNLRYFIKGNSDVNRAVRDTIERESDHFWYRNNGITIVCDSFEVDGKELKLSNFSIVNGGQTTTLLYRSHFDSDSPDFFIACKVIKAQGLTEEEKEMFVLKVAQSTNSQKPIRQSDLKANQPEQVRFAKELRNVGVFYRTKRGEVVPKEYKAEYKNTDIAEAGKLALAGLFQLPATSRNKPSSMYREEYYNPVFKEQPAIASKCIRDLLFINCYFKNSFVKVFDARNEGRKDLLLFAHNSRTICIAFVALASRIGQGDIKNFPALIEGAQEDDFQKTFYDKLKDFSYIKHLILPSAFEGDRDVLEKHLYGICSTIISEGSMVHNLAGHGADPSNFLKKDSNYFLILKNCWDHIERDIREHKVIFTD